MNPITAFIPDPRYRELDQREEQLKRELETVRAEKQEIAQKHFLGSASKETGKQSLKARSQTQAESTSARKPIQTQSTLP